MVVEEDFGQGMFAKLLQPYVQAEWKKTKAGRGATEIATERAQKVAKELRILGVLEPLFDGHRLVVDQGVFLEDYKQVMRREGTEMRDRYSLMYQITRLTREKGCLTHDDRVEGIAGLLNTLSEFLGLDRDEAAEKAADKRLEEYYGKLLGEQDRLSGTTQGRSSYRGKLRGGNAVRKVRKLFKRKRTR